MLDRARYDKREERKRMGHGEGRKMAGDRESDCELITMSATHAVVCVTEESS